MKLLQTLVEAVSTKAQTAANEIVADQAKIASLAKGAAGYLKKQFGEALMDSPRDTLIQTVRSYIDTATSTRLNKDGLEMVLKAVLENIMPYLRESEDAAGLELSESKMSELDLDFDELSGTEFKKKYKCTKAEMRKKVSESDDSAEDGGEELAEAAVEESVLGTPGQEQSVETVFHLILADELDAYDVMTRPQGPMQRKAAKIIQRMYDSHTEGTGLHGDDDVEQIMLSVYEDIEMTYGEGAGQSPFESVHETHQSNVTMKHAKNPTAAQLKAANDIKPGIKGYRDRAAMLKDLEATGKLKESDDFVLNKAAKEVVAGKITADEAAKKYNLSKGELRGEINLVKDLEYRKRKGMKEDAEDLEEATRGRPRKNPPKEEKAPAKRGRPAKNATEQKPAAKKADDSDDGDDEKKVSSKALAKSMENDDGEEDADAKKADSAAKDTPKKIADTSVKPEQLTDANKKLSKQIQHAVHTSSATSAFALSKELRAAFKDITSDEVKQACTIWKSEN